MESPPFLVSLVIGGGLFLGLAARGSGVLRKKIRLWQKDRERRAARARESAVGRVLGDPAYDRGPCEANTRESLERIGREGAGIAAALVDELIADPLLADHVAVGLPRVMERLGAGGARPWPIDWATSNHVHFLLAPSTALRLARFMQFVNANFAKEAARLHKWPDRIWSRRYRAIPIVDDCDALARMRYQLSHGEKEGLVAGAREWPGINGIAALTHGDPLRGTWFDRTAEYRARAAGKKVKPGDFATAYEVKLTPLPCLCHMDVDQRQAHYRRLVHDIDEKAKETNEQLRRQPLGVRAILAQDPHHRPDSIKRSPAPLVHAHDRAKGAEYLTAYRDFVIAFRAGAADLSARAMELTKLFTDWSFPPPLAFREAPKAA